MDEQNKFPSASPEIARMLGLANPQANFHPAVSAQEPDQGQAQNPGHQPSSSGPAAKPSHAGLPGTHAEHGSLPADRRLKNVLAALKGITPYLAVFSVALFAYFYFFSPSRLDFSSVGRVFSGTKQAAVSAKQGSLAELQKQNMDGYRTWIAQFYFDVSDPSLLDPEADNSGNGLSNFQKYLLNLNPKSYDTLGLGMPDSQAINAGINPLSGKPLTAAQREIIDKYFDMEVAMNRLAVERLSRQASVAGASVSGTGEPESPARLSENPYGTDGLELDLSQPAQLDVPALKVSVPLIWTKDTKDFDRDLQNGVIHYPGTALPGQIGTAYVSGHSSNYAWAKGSYNRVFSRLGDLGDNQSFSIAAITKEGKRVVFHYVVVGRQEYSPTDQAQFQNSSQSVAALSTCWPVGSTAKRLVVFGQLTQVEK